MLKNSQEIYLRLQPKPDLFSPSMVMKENGSLPLNDKLFKNRAHNGNIDRLSFMAALV